MSADNKPLSYLSLKSVLEYMNVELRFALYQRIPSLRSTSRVVPYMVTNIEVNRYEIKFNNTLFYKLGVVRVYNDQKTPKSIKNRNDAGGKQCDVDKYGFSISTLDGNRGPEYYGGTEWISNVIKRLKNEIREKEAKKEKSMKLAKTEISRRLTEINFDNQLDEDRHYLLPYELRKNRENPPYTHYLQLTIVNGNRRRFEIFEYKKKILEAWGYFTEKMFPNLVPLCRVTTNHIRYINAMVPLNLSLAKPLETLTLENSDQSFMLPARMLIIDDKNGKFTRDINWNNLNLRTHFTESCKISIRRLIDACLNPIRGIGTHYSKSLDAMLCTRYFNEARAVPGAVMRVIPETRGTQTPQCITFARDNETEVNIWVKNVDELCDVLHVKINPRGYSRLD